MSLLVYLYLSTYLVEDIYRYLSIYSLCLSLYLSGLSSGWSLYPLVIALSWSVSSSGFSGICLYTD